MSQKEKSAVKIMVSDPIYNPGSQGPLVYGWYQKTINDVIRPGIKVDFTCLREGYFTTVGTPFPDAINAIGMVERAYEAEKKGYDAFIIGCVWDSDLREARSMVSIPVMAPTESSALLALTLGSKFSVITNSPPKAVKYRELIQSYGLKDRLASVRCPPEFASGTDCFQLMFAGESGQKELTEIVTAEMSKAVKEDKAEVVFYACTMGSTILTMHGVHNICGAVVLDPFVAALKMAEIQIDLHRAYGITVCRASIYQSPAPGWEQQRPIPVE